MLPGIIATERLLLRMAVEGDASRMAAGLGAWPVARMLGGVPYPYERRDALSWIRYCKRREGMHFAERVIILPGEGLIGALGLHPHETLLPQLGYWIGTPWWGRGYMTEAAQALVDAAFAALPITGLVSGHFEENTASARVLAKLGFTYDGDDSPRRCRPRGTMLAHRSMRLHRAASGQAETSEAQAALDES